MTSKNFFGVFPSNFVNHFISFYDIISESGTKHSLVIMKWRKGYTLVEFPQFASKKNFLCLTVLVSKVLRNLLSMMTKMSSIRYFMVLKSFDKKDKITLLTLRFSIPKHKKLKNFDKLCKTTVDLLHLINEYGKKHRLRNEVMVHLVDDQLQVLEKDTWNVSNLFLRKSIQRTR